MIYDDIISKGFLVVRVWPNGTFDYVVNAKKIKDKWCCTYTGAAFAVGRGIICEICKKHNTQHNIITIFKTVEEAQSLINDCKGKWCDSNCNFLVTPAVYVTSIVNNKETSSEFCLYGE